MKNKRLLLIIVLIVSLSFSGYLFITTSTSETSSQLKDAEARYEETIKLETNLDRELSQLNKKVEDKVDSLHKLKEDYAKSSRVVTRLEAELSLDRSISETSVSNLSDLVSMYGLSKTLDACYFALYESESFDDNEDVYKYLNDNVTQKYEHNNRYSIGLYSYIHWLYYAGELNLFKWIDDDWIITQIITPDRTRREVYIKLGDHYYMKSFHNVLNEKTNDEFYIQGEWIDVTDSISEEGVPYYNTMKNLIRMTRGELIDG